MSSDILDQETKLWESTLGVLPVRLFHLQDEKHKQFIMLNGNKNNFGLDLEGYQSQITAQQYRSYAWSSDVDSFISLQKDTVHVHRWNRQGYEEYTKSVVFNNIEKFYHYLEHTSQKKENAIVPYAIRTFRSIRNYLNDKKDGQLSLQAFLYLLAVAEERAAGFKLDHWGLNPNVIDIVKNLPINRFLEEFLNGLNHSALRPNIDLILRHAAGSLFQEAHYEAVLTGQLNLVGTASPDILTSAPKYSSVHFTPSYIARSVVEESLNNLDLTFTQLRIFDPSCGSGEFLKEALRQLKNRGFFGSVHVVGWDISEPAIDMAKFLLAFEAREWNGRVTIELEKVEDSLTKNWHTNFDLILMNPPFLSWELMSSEQREAVVNVLGNNYKRNPNLASAFLWKAVSCLKQEGVLGCVLPSSILNADSYIELRQEVQNIVCPLLVAKLGNYVFQSAFTDASLFIAYKGQGQKTGTKFVWTYNTANAAPDAMRALRKQKFDNTFFVEKEYSIYNVNNLGSNWLPMKYESWVLKDSLFANLRLGRIIEAKEIFDIRLGARIGNPVFTINLDIYEKLSTSEKKFFRPVVLNKAIKKGKLSIVSYLFYPKSSNLEPIKTEQDLEKRVPLFYKNYLKPSKESLLKRTRIDERNWWHLSEARAWQYSRNEKLVSTEFGKAGSFAFDETGEFVVERGLAWIPKNSDKFTEETYYAYLAIFCSPLFNELLAIFSKQIAGGEWWDLSKRYVQNIPIPNLSLESVFTSGEFTELSRYGKDMSEGIAVSEAQLISVVKTIYGLY